MKLFLTLVVVLTGIGAVNAQDFGRVVSDKAVVRNVGSTAGEAVGEIGKGLTFEIMAERGEWLLIQTRKLVGWLHMDDVMLIDDADSDVASSAGTVYLAPRRTPVRKKTTTRRKAAVVSSGYIRGPRGGCYYMSGRRKVYVDRGLCAG